MHNKTRLHLLDPHLAESINLLTADEQHQVTLDVIQLIMDRLPLANPIIKKSIDHLQRNLPIPPTVVRTGRGGNQAHHFWFYVQVGYESGLLSGVGGSAIHETILGDPMGKSYEDYALGVEGAILGKALNIGIVQPSEVGDYIRRTLSPGSYSSYYWQHPIRPIP